MRFPVHTSHTSEANLLDTRAREDASFSAFLAVHFLHSHQSHEPSNLSRPSASACCHVARHPGNMIARSLRSLEMACGKSDLSRTGTVCSMSCGQTATTMLQWLNYYS